LESSTEIVLSLKPTHSSQAKLAQISDPHSSSSLQ